MMTSQAKQHLAWHMLDQAIAYVEHGLSVVPLRLDGSKGPIGSWKWRQESLPKWLDLKADFHDRPVGIGIVCGVVSGGLEVLDFDAGELFFPWREMVANIVAKLPVVQTPKGFHVYFRCDVISGNSKIAYLKGRQEAAIESRGQCGYVVAPGSPACVHPKGILYQQVSGPSLPRPQLEPGGTIHCGVGVPVISEAERLALWSAARSFDQRGQAEAATEAAAKQLARQMRGAEAAASDNDPSTPWGHFALQGPPWREILEPCGWTSHDGVYWRRPGKQDDGHSAVVRMSDSGCEVLVVWSSSGGAIAPDGGGHRSLNKYEAYKQLYHSGNGKSAASELSRQGWGRRSAS